MNASKIEKKVKKPMRITICLLFILGWSQAQSQIADAQECPDPAPQTTGTHLFRHLGETFHIPITLGDCQAISLTLRWSNGRNNGALLNLTFLDGDDRPLYAKQVSAFMTGVFEFPLLPVDQQIYGMMSVQSVPALVSVQTAYPFGSPAAFTYTITRANRRPRGRLRGIDAKLATSLQTAPGRLLSTTSGYTLTEVPLPEPRELELPGKRRTVRNAFRIQLAAEKVAAFGDPIDLMWIDDIAMPVFRSGATTGALIFDEAVLQNGAELAVSNLAAHRFQTFPERLIYQSRSSGGDLALTEEGNVVVAIKNSARVIGGRRQALIQMQLRTSRPFPARDSALQLQVGRRLFVDELAGDFTGRTLTLTLTPEMFAELSDGAAIMAFYGKPDGSGSSGNDVWYFGRLNKRLVE